LVLVGVREEIVDKLLANLDVHLGPAVQQQDLALSLGVKDPVVAYEVVDVYIALIRIHLLLPKLNPVLILVFNTEVIIYHFVVELFVVYLVHIFSFLIGFVENVQHLDSLPYRLLIIFL